MITCTFENGNKAHLRHITCGALILNNEKSKILLARRSAKWSEPHKLALPGGYMDRDETLAQATEREVREETGYEIQIEQLFCITDSPIRPGGDRQDIDVIFLSTAGEKVGEPDEDVEEIQWYDLINLPSKEEFAFDHYRNVELLVKHLQKPLMLPIIQ